MTEADPKIAEKFAHIVADGLHIEPSLVSLDAHLDDLGAESLDLIEITMESEAAFNVWIPEKSILETAVEVCGPGVIEQDGFLTEQGRRLMMLRLPQAEAIALPEKLSVQDLKRYFLQVGTWVRMIAELRKHTPSICPACSGSLAPTPGLRMKCKSCGAEVPLRSGEELNREWVLENCSASQGSHAAAPGVGEPVCLG